MKLCDIDCNHCPIVGHKNSRMVTFILNSLLERFGKGVYEIVQSACPNLTCCFDCRIDGFYHVEGCEIAAAAEEKYGNLTRNTTQAKITELSEAYTEWQDTSDYFPSDRLLNAIGELTIMGERGNE